MQIEFGDKLRHYRKCHSLSQEEVAKVLEIHKSTYAHYESGNRKPDKDALLKLSKLFHTTVDELLSPNLPLVIRIKFPSEMLDNLEKAIKQYGTLSDDWKTNKHNLDELEKASQPVFNYRQQAFRVPEIALNSTFIPIGEFTIQTVGLDPRGERLIFEYLDLYQKIVRSLWPS